jgi:hypothetical protein
LWLVLWCVVCIEGCRIPLMVVCICWNIPALMRPPAVPHEHVLNVYIASLLWLRLNLCEALQQERDGVG